MWSHQVVVLDVLPQNATKMQFAEQDHVVQILSSKRPDQALGNAVGVRCPLRRHYSVDADSGCSLDEVRPEAAVGRIRCLRFSPQRVASITCRQILAALGSGSRTSAPCGDGRVQ